MELASRFNTCICIEHNLDVIKTADWVVDLGPEAGDDGGTIVVEGPPETVAESAGSHTGAALKPILQAGPTARREVHDPAKQSDIEQTLAVPIDLGSDLKMPWDRDGQTWHTVDHVDHQGSPAEWDPQLLIWLIESMEPLGEFLPTDWNHRTRIEVTASRDKHWFCHILTGSKDLLEVTIRVGQGTFCHTDLPGKLKIKTLDERRDLPIYGHWDRVRLRAPHPGWQEIRLYLRDFMDVDKRAFRSFLKMAAESYFRKLRAVKADSVEAQPWKTQGLEWHFSQKSIHRHHVIRWKPTTLVAMIGRLKAIEPHLEFSWTIRTAGHFSIPGEQQTAGKIVTNMGRGLRIELYAPKNAITPTQIDRLGEDPDIKPQRDYDRITFWVRSLSQNDANQLREVWALCRGAKLEEVVPST
ncbi:MAG: hypothetical protein KJ749_07370 [Planctomycetes bacterium]|nr:hypothetical protein [Planctomycetota bacterium]